MVGNTIAGSYTVTAVAVGASPVTFSLTNTPGAATHFVLSGPTSVASGTAFNITVTAFDAYGNRATGYRGTIKFSSSDKDAVLPDKQTFTVADTGTHTFTGLKLRKKGEQTITIFDAADKTILGTFTINVT